MGKGSNDSSTTKTKVEPWAPLKPYLMGAAEDAKNLYNQGAPSYYPGQTYAPMSSYTKQGLDALAQRGAYGSDLSRSAQSELTDTINGKYLNSNPYLQGAINAAVQPITNAFSGEVMPGIDSNFSAAGRYGSGLQGAAYNDANTTLAQQIGNVSTNMAYQNYGDERQRQMQAMLFAPEMAAQDYKDILALQDAGRGYDQYNQGILDADMARYDYNQNADYNWLSNYIGLLGGFPGNSSTQTAKTPRPSTLETIGGYILNNMGNAAKAYAGG